MESKIVDSKVHPLNIIFHDKYAVDFYHKKGFRDLQGETVADGIRFTPMELVFR